MPELFDYINSLNSKEYIYDEDDSKSYNQFMVNKFLMHFPDTVFVANEVNARKMSDKMHYDFLFHFLPKKKRYTKWYKEVKMPNLELIMEYFDVSEHVALSYSKLLNEHDLVRMSTIMQKGGKK